MSSTVLFTFQDATQRDKFVQLIKYTSLGAVSVDDILLSLENQELLKIAVKSASNDPQVRIDEDKLVGLFVAGKKLVEGNLKDIRRRFHQEIAAHSGSVEIRELRGDTWKVLQSRKLQK
jgi:hypothetical protein